MEYYFVCLTQCILRLIQSWKLPENFPPSMCRENWLARSQDGVNAVDWVYQQSFLFSGKA